MPSHLRSRVVRRSVKHLARIAPLVAMACAIGACSSGDATARASASSTDTRSAEPPTPTSPPRPTLVFRTTSELVTTPAVRDAVDQLAKQKQIESSHVGAAGAPSAAYKIFEAAWSAASDVDRERLLGHESPIVRGYFAQRFGREAAVMPAGVASLLDDATRVSTLQGCSGGDDSVARVVLDALCWSNAPGAGKALVEAARGGGSLAGEALACVAPKAPAEAAALAVSNIQRGAPEKLLTGSFRVLAVSPDAAGCGPARDAATSGSPDLVLAAVSALALCADDASLAVLRRASSSPNLSVARGAKLSLILDPKTPADERRALASDKPTLDSLSHRLGAILRSPTGSLVVLPLLDELLALGPASAPSALSGLAESAEATAAMRALAAKSAAPTDANGYTVHTAALAYLARVADAASLPLFRAALDGVSVQEIRVALGAVRDLADAASRGRVEKLTTHPQKDVATLATDVLAKLPKL